MHFKIVFFYFIEHAIGYLIDLCLICVHFECVSFKKVFFNSVNMEYLFIPLHLL